MSPRLHLRRLANDRFFRQSLSLPRSIALRPTPTLNKPKTITSVVAPLTSQRQKKYLSGPHGQHKSFHSSLLLEKEAAGPRVAKAADLTIEEYHKKADAYIETLVTALEVMQDEKEDMDVEYSAGVLTLIFPPLGTYVLNKQPPNKQIWISSPVSGPKRYDYVYVDEDAPDEGGKWVYLRDGSKLTNLFEEEIGVIVDHLAE